MGRIILVDAECVTIRLLDGDIIKVPHSEIPFAPVVGDEVEVIEFNGKKVVRKVYEQQNEFINNYPGVKQKGKWVDKVTYCILAGVLGCFGIHKFYSGKIIMGILYILFSFTWIPGFLGIIEMIIAICKTPNSLGQIYIK